MIALLLELVKSPFVKVRQGALWAIVGLAENDPTGYAAEAVIAAGSIVHMHDDTASHSDFNHMVHPGQPVLLCSPAQTLQGLKCCAWRCNEALICQEMFLGAHSSKTSL